MASAVAAAAVLRALAPAAVPRPRARCPTCREGVEDHIRFVERDLFKVPLHDATVVTLYLLPEVNVRLRPRLLAQLRPGARIVSHDFDMGDWKPNETVTQTGSIIHLWRVPAL
jgi:hypothetical protein